MLGALRPPAWWPGEPVAAGFPGRRFHALPPIFIRTWSARRRRAKDAQVSRQLLQSRTWTRSVHSRELGAHRSGCGLAASGNNPQLRSVRGNGHGNGQSTGRQRRRTHPIHRRATSTVCLRPLSQCVLNMSAFDPSKIRKAVEEFTPRRPQKFHELFAAKDVIVELRQKHASYRSIADLLTRHCLPTCKTSVALFCHKILGEATRTRGRPAREQPLESEAPVIAPLPM
jgi:hypothetical protein